MSKKYVIQWKSKVNGRAGQGTKLFEREEGEELVQELNQDYPDIQHELINSEGKNRGNESPPEASPASEPQQEEAETPSAQNPQVISLNA